MLDKTEQTVAHIPAGELNDALKRVKHAISREETRYYLGGAFVHFDKDRRAFKVVATDGHRLAIVECGKSDEIVDFTPAILPRDFISAAIKSTNKRYRGHFDCPLIVRGQELELHPYNEPAVTGQAIDGTYPDYLRVIPRDTEFAVQLNRKAFLACADALASTLESLGAGVAVRLVFANAECTISLARAESDYSLSAKATLAFKGNLKAETFEIGFNARYLAELLASLEGETVEIRLNDAGSPTVFAGTDARDAHALHVLMPMRI